MEIRKHIISWKYAVILSFVCCLLLAYYMAGCFRIFYSSLDDYVVQVMQQLHVPGLALAIIHDDQIMYMKGYGVLEIGKDDLVTVETPFQIGSCTKAFTAAALALLVDENSITWQDKAHELLSDFKLYDEYVTKELTIVDMLSHRSAIEDSGLLYFYSPLSREQLIHQMRYLLPQAAFRTEAVYNNLMYLAAGQIVSNVSGISWDDFITQRFLVPLNMKKSTANIRIFTDQMFLAKPHMLVNDGLISMNPLDLYNVGPAGSIISTVTDMAQWVRMLLNHGKYEDSVIIKPETVHQMHSPESIRVKEHPFYMYGFGWGISDYHGNKEVTHKGSLDGASSIVSMLPDKNVGVIVLTNMHNCEAREGIVNYIFDHILNRSSSIDWLKTQVEKEQEAQEKEIEKQKQLENKHLIDTKPTLELDRYVGIYHNDLYGDMTVKQKNNHLHCQFLFLNELLYHWYNDSFMLDSSVDYPTVGEKFLLHFHVKNNKVDAVSIKIAGNKESIFTKY